MARWACARTIVPLPKICKSRSLAVTAHLASEEVALGKGSLSRDLVEAQNLPLLPRLQSKWLKLLPFLKVPPRPAIFHVTTAHLRKFGKYRKVQEWKTKYCPRYHNTGAAGTTAHRSASWPKGKSSEAVTVSSFLTSLFLPQGIYKM